jgi:hypothetical protein
MSPDLRKTLSKLKGGGKASDRRRVSMYFSDSVYSEFKRICDADGISTNKVIEEWMRESLKGNRAKK